MRRAALALLAAGLLAGCAAVPPAPATQPEGSSGWRSGLKAETATRFMAAAAHPLAAAAGRQILARGGSAVDAAIAMQMVLTLVEPQSSGIGGGAFLLHWDGHAVRTYDGRETAPASADEYLFVSPQGRAMQFEDAVAGGRAVGSPGVLAMLHMVHAQYGRLAWSGLFDPAIDLAERGFPLSPRLHTLLAAENALRADAAARLHFYAADGQPKPIGSRLTNPALANTLRIIARDGAGALYAGPLADDIVAAVRGHATNPGRLTATDLAQYRARERPPLCTVYKRWRVCGMGPPSSGGIAVAQMLGILAQHDVAAHLPTRVGDRHVPQADAVHLFSEAGRLAFADRATYVADPDFVPVDSAALVDSAYLSQRAALITGCSLGRAKPGHPPGLPAHWAEDRSPHRHATSHLAAVDRWGHAVSMTTSIEDAFGARLMVRGFLLNNQLTDFSFLPTEANADGVGKPGGVPVANRVQPGKRPRSSMAPTLVFDRDSGELIAALGSPGGSQIINYVAKTLIALLDWKLDIQEAIELPNFGSRNGPTELEDGRIDPALAQRLRQLGHEPRMLPMTSGIQGIVRIRSADGLPLWTGGADPRREGAVLGD